ncbi:MAG: hypothetical protein JW957_06070 [Candidatus Omnitrophica bacterium]|nr:hypothetical protein [Candidatus Omnitrophota bacterium]
MFNPEIILALVNTGIALVMFTLSAIMLKIGRKKFLTAIALSGIYLLINVYYICLISFSNRPSIMETQVVNPARVLPNESPASGLNAPEAEAVVYEPDFHVVIIAGNNSFTVAPGDELEIKKNVAFEIKEVQYPQGNKENLKADLKGFAGNARFNDSQDIGYRITYDGIMKHWAVEGETDKYEIIAKDGKEPLGSIYIKFID